MSLHFTHDRAFPLIAESWLPLYISAWVSIPLEVMHSGSAFTVLIGRGEASSLAKCVARLTARYMMEKTRIVL